MGVKQLTLLLAVFAAAAIAHDDHNGKCVDSK